MYAHVLKTSEGAKKAWLTRRNGKAAASSPSGGKSPSTPLDHAAASLKALGFKSPVHHKDGTTDFHFMGNPKSVPQKAMMVHQALVASGYKHDPKSSTMQDGMQIEFFDGPKKSSLILVRDRDGLSVQHQPGDLPATAKPKMAKKSAAQEHAGSIAAAIGLA